MQAISIHPITSARAGAPLHWLVFFQMLPATLLSPAIRPLFAGHHAGNESAMHAFMAVNMCAAVLCVPWLCAWADRMRDTRALMTSLVAADSLLLWLLAVPMPTHGLLVLRALEGVAHVGVTSMLLAMASREASAQQRPELMGKAGAALMFAVAAGSTLGGICVSHDVRLPFWLGSGVQAFVALSLSRSQLSFVGQPAQARAERSSLWRDKTLVVPALAVFVGRFTVGCLVVTFALFAHRVHQLSDRSVGLLFTLVTLPFAASMYPVSRLAQRIPRAVLLAVGAVVHACALLALGRVSAAWLPVNMLVMGVASAFLFAPTLCYAGPRGDERRHLRMAVLNAAGCLGMVVGPTAAGITSAVVGRVDPASGYRAVFVLASASVGAWLLLSLPWILRQARAELSGPDAAYTSAPKGARR